MESCSIRSCINYRRYDPNIELYPLPASDDEKMMWARAFGLTIIDLKSASTRVCGAHFRRKYFLASKPETKQNVNGSTPLLMLNPTSATSNVTFNKVINSSAFPNFMALKTAQEPGTYRLHIPDLVHYPSMSPSTSSSIIQPYTVGNTSAPNMFAIPNKTVQPVNISSESPAVNNSCSEIPLTVDSCELFCKEESLTPEQEKFQQEEWLNFVKFTAKLTNFPYVSAVNGSEVGEKVLDSTSSQELPVLVYTNIPREQQSTPSSLPTTFAPNSALVSTVSNSVLLQSSNTPSNAPFVCQIPSNISTPLNQVQIPSNISAPLNPIQIPSNISTPLNPIQIPSNISTPLNPIQIPSNISTPLNPIQIPSNISAPLNPVHPVANTLSPVFTSITPVVSQNNTLPIIIRPPNPSIPVQLDKSNGQLIEKLPISQTKDEEIFPKVLQDTTTEKILGTVNNASLPLSPICEIRVSDESINDKESVASPALSVSSGNDRYVSPDLLCNVEVNLEEKESMPLVTENTPTTLGSELESNNSNGPKIVDVLSGDAGANEFYKGITEAEMASEQDAKAEAVPSENSMPKMVTQWSIFSMQKTIAVISSGNIDATVRNLLGLRIHIPPLNAERDIPTRLKNRLREEHFLTLTPLWMLNKRCLSTSPPCSKCKGKIFRLNSCLEFLDNLSWTCVKCKDITPVKRPKFFERFPSFSLEELLLLTYHWACKSRLWVINYDVPVHVERIWEYFNALQDLCGDSVSRNNFIGKSTKHTITVEVSAVKLGRFFILCAYDRRSKVSRLKALTTEEACGSLKHINVLQEWLGDNCTLITWKKISDEFLPNVIKLSADPSIGHVQSPGRHILNASKYLGKTMVQLFQNINHEQLTLETVQRILNEVQWRERHGRNEETAFWEILNEISRLDKIYTYTEAQLGEISKDRFYYKADVPFRLRWGPYDTTNKASVMAFAPAKQVKQVNESRIIRIIPESIQNTTNAIQSSSSSINISDDILSVKKHPISVTNIPPVKEKNIAETPISAQELLSVKILFTNDENVLREHQIQAHKLGLKLKEQGYLEYPVRWFCNKKYLKEKSSCYVCQGPAIINYNPKFTDSYSWLCLKPACKFENEFQRPPFFAALGFPLNVILAVIFHWAVQSDYNVVTQAVPMNEFSIIGIYRRIQKMFSEFQSSFKIGGKQNLVEVAFVRFANCFILGAMERSTKLSRFRTFSSEIKLHIDIIRKTLISWLYEDSTVVVNSNKYLGRYSMEEKIHLVFADQTVTDVNSTLYHTLTITSYLQGHIKTMFQSIKVQKMSSDLLQMYLDELMWRERYGKTPVDAFNSIMNAIFFRETTTKVIDDDVLLVRAAQYYGFKLPLPKLSVSLERLPDHVIHSYTTKVSNTQNITVIDDFEPTKEIKQEPISDDEIEIVDYVPNSESTSSLSSKISVASSSSLASETDKNEIVALELSNDERSFNKSMKKSIKNEKMNLHQYFSMKKSDSFNSYQSHPNRYSDKCYGHRRRCYDLKDGKSRCIECKEIVSEDHFVKQYSCGDCKCYVYSTHCQKAFARHRSYVLFGRKISNDSVYNRSIHLPQKWYCSCGYGSKEGNKLASHLIKCRKSTCYLKSNNSVIIL